MNLKGKKVKEKTEIKIFNEFIKSIQTIHISLKSIQIKILYLLEAITNQEKRLKLLEKRLEAVENKQNKVTNTGIIQNLESDKIN